MRAVVASVVPRLRSALAFALLVVVALCFLGGCGAEEGTPVRSWTLVDRDGRSSEIVLPAHVEVPRDAAYVLRARVDRPEALRRTALTLSIANLPAPVSLVANGQPVLAVSGGTGDSYRTAGAHAWRLPAGDGPLELELTVDHRWMGSALLDSVPRLSGGTKEARPFATRRVLTDLGMILALGILPPLGIAYLALWLGDRRRRAYAWLAVQMFTGTYYALWGLAATSPVLGRYDLLPLLLTQVLSPLAGIYLMHATLPLGPPPRILLWLFTISAALAPAALFPYGISLALWALVPFDVIAVSYLLLVLAKLARGGESAVTARLFLIAIVGFAVSVSIEGPWWLGMGDRLEGVRPAGWSLIVLAALETVLLGREHKLAVERSDALNRELTRQVADRSKELADALARLQHEAAPDLEQGQIIDGRYVVGRRIGHGGMGAVYAVSRKSDGADLALKVMTRRIDARASARFAREAEVLSRVAHPNVVSVVDVQVAREGFLYLVMEHVEGSPLSQAKARFGDVAWALDMLTGIASGLGAIHDAGIVHRDLKPSNVLVEGSTPKICDFGISKSFAGFTEPAGGGDGETSTHILQDDEPPPLSDERVSVSQVARPTPESLPPSSRDPQALTEAGARLGTPLYMAPELGAGTSKAGPALDVYSLGLIACELLTGVHPRRDPANRTLSDRNPGIPKALSDLIQRTLAIQPERRPTARELAAAFADARSAVVAGVS